MRPNPQKTADLLTFTEEILNGKFHVLCNVSSTIFLLKLEPVKLKGWLGPFRKLEMSIMLVFLVYYQIRNLKKIQCTKE